ncbi:MAG: hypothetical protein ACYC64_17460 [Armatimonadota bacterium]
MKCADEYRNGHELSSGDSRLTIDEASGQIRHLTYNGRTLIEHSGTTGPFRLHVPLPAFEAHMVEGNHVKPEISRAADAVICRYTHVAGKRGPIDIDVEIRYSSVGDGTFEMQCRLKNNSLYGIPQIFFPWVSGFAKVDDDDDQATFGGSSFKPWKEWHKRTEYDKVLFMNHLKRPYRVAQPFYPYSENGLLAGLMKWIDLSGMSAGTSLYSKDTGAKIQYMLVAADDYGKDTIDLAWFHYPFVEPKTEWHSAVFVLCPHGGDWHQGALKFKEFADRAFTTVSSAPERDETIGSQTLWIGWHYQDWSDSKYSFKDIPAIAAEARKAGFREMMLARATELDFSLPHVLRSQLGTEKDLNDALEKSRELGVNTSFFVTCRLIRPETIPKGENKEEWWFKNVAQQTIASNWTYDPHMIPNMPINQIGSRAAYLACAGSEGWQKAYWENLDMLGSKWGCHGMLFDVSCTFGWGLCFNPLHSHRPDEEMTCLNEVLSKTRSLLQERFGSDAVVVGEGQWDAATQWADYTWDWVPFKGEEFAPFTMAFPRARRCCKCSDDKSLINKIFASGYWLDLYLEDGGARLGDYPELTDYLASLARFKMRFVNTLGKRDAYLHDLYVKADSVDGVWVRTHRNGSEALIMVTHEEGKTFSTDLTIDLKSMLGEGKKSVEVWTRDLQMKTSISATDSATLQLEVPSEDFVAVHITAAIR